MVSRRAVRTAWLMKIRIQKGSDGEGRLYGGVDLCNAPLLSFLSPGVARVSKRSTARAMKRSYHHTRAALTSLYRNPPDAPKGMPSDDDKKGDAPPLVYWDVQEKDRRIDVLCFA